MKKALFLVALVAVALSTEAKTVKKTINVAGACSQCETRIEKTAKAVNGVISANWNKNTKKMAVVFDDKKTSEKAISEALAKVGHDAGAVKATAAAYNKLPGCCKYRTNKTH